MMCYFQHFYDIRRISVFQNLWENFRPLASKCFFSSSSIPKAIYPLIQQLWLNYQHTKVPMDSHRGVLKIAPPKQWKRYKWKRRLLSTGSWYTPVNTEVVTVWDSLSCFTSFIFTHFIYWMCDSLKQSKFS